MALSGIDPASLEIILNLQRDDFERFATMKRHRNGGISGDHDVAMKLWADELDSIAAGAPTRKKFREIWSSGDVKIEEAATARDQVPPQTDESPSSPFMTPAPASPELPMTPVESPFWAPEWPRSPSSVDHKNEHEETSVSPVIRDFEDSPPISPDPGKAETIDEPIEDSFAVPEEIPEEILEEILESEAESKSFLGFEAVPPLGPVKTCIVCSEALPLLERVECPCSHLYCFPCLNNFVRVSMEDESRFPPRCCGQTIPRATIKSSLSAENWNQYLAKIVEVRTPVRLYCHACTGFVPSTQIENDIGQCKTCGSRTCVYCKKKEHQNECPKDKATAKFLRFAKTQEWQRCPSCRTMVEKRYGCHHMSE
jgi:hypothetical protein